MTDNAATTFPFNSRAFRVDRFTENKGIYIIAEDDITVHGSNGVPNSVGMSAVCVSSYLGQQVK